MLFSSKIAKVKHMPIRGLQRVQNDWALLGDYVINNLKKYNCFRNYINQGTSTQIDSPAFGDNREYGYQM
jgi:hypothetical protein